MIHHAPSAERAPSAPHAGRRAAPRARPAHPERAEEGGPAPRRPPPAGRLLAVCGTCGGAGTSTLSYLIARFSTQRDRGHVLVCDTGGPTAALAIYAGVQSPRSLTELGTQLAGNGDVTDAPYAVDATTATAGSELRVIARGPQIEETGDATGLPALLGMARAAHALTVVDCGTRQREADRAALAAASHVAWVLPASRSGARRAQQALAGQPAATGRELVIARRERHAQAAGLRALRALAEQRRAPLVFVPHLPDLLDDPAGALEEARAALQTITGVLAR